MSQIFVSYASEDRRRVRRLVEALEERGWSLFWDRKIPAGRTYDEFIGDEIEAAKCVLVVWSKKSVAKGKKWVREEAIEGNDRGVLIPVRIDDVKPPFGLRRIQAVDLTDWKGDRAAPELHRLAAAIEDLVASGTAGDGEVWGKPGEKVAIGIYEERDPNGGELSDPRRIRIADASQPLPPTTKPGHWWTKV